jgi:hypothetical protein
MSTVRPDERNKQKRGVAERDYFHALSLVAPPIAQSNSTIVIGRRG